MAFITHAIEVLLALVIVLGTGIAVWGYVDFMKGNPSTKSQGVKQLIAGGGVALIGTTLTLLFQLHFQGGCT